MDVMIYLNGGLSKHNAFTFNPIVEASSLTATAAAHPCPSIGKDIDWSMMVEIVSFSSRPDPIRL